MDKKIIIITAMLLLLAGCTSTIDITSIVKSLPQVKDFLIQYPDAELKVVLWSQNYTASQIDEVQNICGKQMEVKPYYYATVIKGLFNLKVWIDKETIEINCLIKSGGNATEDNTSGSIDNNDENITDDGSEIIEDDEVEITDDNVITCGEYCESQPHIQCVGEWSITGTYPDCTCSFICTTEEPQPEEVEFEEWTDGKVSIQIPKGWTAVSYGECATKSIRVYDPESPVNQVFYFSEAGPVYTTQAQKDWDEYYISMGGYVLPYVDSPVVEPFTAESYLSHFKELGEAYIMSTIAPSAPKMEDFQFISSEDSATRILPEADEAKLIRALFIQDSNLGEGLFYVETYNFVYSSLGYGMTLIGLTSEEGKFLENENMLNQVIASYTISTTYVSQCIQAQQQALSGALRVGQTLSETSDIIMDSWESRQISDDIISERWSDTTLGYERVYDPDTGEVYRVDNGFYDAYNINRDNYDNSNLEQLPDNDWNLWTSSYKYQEDIN